MLSEISSFVNYVRRRNPESRTYRNYRCDLKQFAACVGEVDPEQVTVHNIDSFIVHQANKGLQTATINRQLNTVKAFYSYLADEDPSLTCPVLPHRHHLVTPQRLPRPAAQPDLDRLFSVITDTRDRAIFLLMLAQWVAHLRSGKAQAM